MTDQEIEKLADGVLESVEKLIQKRIEQALKLNGRMEQIEAAANTSETLKSAGRQLSRHAEHLAGIETRLKKLERAAQ